MSEKREKGPPQGRETMSPCCKSPVTPCEMVTVKKPYGESYYYNTCTACGAYVWPILKRLWDSNGDEILEGDIIENPEASKNRCDGHHAVYREDDGGLEIRDIGANNVGMYQQEDYFTLGPYWKNLHLLDDDDLEYYWNTTREEALKETRDD